MRSTTHSEFGIWTLTRAGGGLSLTARGEEGSGILRFALNDTTTGVGSDTTEGRWRGKRKSIRPFLARALPVSFNAAAFFYDDDHNLCAKPSPCFALRMGAVSAF